MKTAYMMRESFKAEERERLASEFVEQFSGKPFPCLQDMFKWLRSGGRKP